MIKLKSLVNESFFDMFKKREKAVEKEKKVDYNPKSIGYGHPDFEKEHGGFSKDPDAEIEESSKELFKIGEALKPLLTRYVLEEEHVLEMMIQQDMVNGNGANKEYIVMMKEWLKQLEDTDLKVRKGVW